jgi:hypothetical protein
MELDGTFADFDDAAVYQRCRDLAVDPQSLNFVVELGPVESRIAFNLRAGDIKDLLVPRGYHDRRVRWMWVHLSGCSELH